MQNDPQKFLEVALAAVKKAEPVFTKHFGKPATISEKTSDRDWVTNADKEIEEMLVSEIRAAFPSHEIVGEEFSATLKPTGEFSWYIDPIDGTSQYIHGIPLCCISVALIDSKGPLVAVISSPETEEVFHAVRGGGAYKNGQPITVSKKAELTSSYGGIGWSNSELLEGFVARIMPFIGKVRVFATSALQMCFVADGRFDTYVVTGIKPWDIAAGVLIAQEAGASVTGFDNRPYRISDTEALATNGLLHAPFLEVIKRVRKTNV
jgi:myo-inositol-1(or 4)-monophosphatase